MDYHLNLFRFFNETEDRTFIENNLSRAFSICLNNNSFFLNDYIRAIVTNEDYEYLFTSISTETNFTIDIQIDTATVEIVSYKKIYAVAMTSDHLLDMDDFFSQRDLGDKKNITDVLISLKDIAIIIEVKRTEENCKEQLYNQILPFIKEKLEVIPKKFSWQDTIKLMQRVKNVQQLASQNSIFISDFLDLSEIRFPHWFEPKPFNLINFSSLHGSTDYTQLSKRMRQALSSSKFSVLNYYDRLGIAAPFGWASEIIPEFQNFEEGIKEMVVFYIWPGNTKTQGYQIYDKPLNWQEKETLNVNGKEYPLEVAYNIKLSHFNRFISGMTFYNRDLLKQINTADNFYNKSGKWNIDDWNNFEIFMDEHFNPDFKWREKCDWEGNFKNTDRTYFTMSIGYEVALFIPYSYFKTVDKTEADIVNISNFINEIANSYQTLIG